MSHLNYNHIASKQVRAALLLKREYTRSFFSGTLDIAREKEPLITQARTMDTNTLPHYEHCLARTAEGSLAFEPIGHTRTQLTPHKYVVDLLY